ncbi:hypothetical protein HK096_007802, partial [Nowakowskiella sp. JEL0078]
MTPEQVQQKIFPESEKEKLRRPSPPPPQPKNRNRNFQKRLLLMGIVPNSVVSFENERNQLAEEKKRKDYEREMKEKEEIFRLKQEEIRKELNSRKGVKATEQDFKYFGSIEESMETINEPNSVQEIIQIPNPEPVLKILSEPPQPRKLISKNNLSSKQIIPVIVPVQVPVSEPSVTFVELEPQTFTLPSEPVEVTTEPEPTNELPHDIVPEISIVSDIKTERVLYSKPPPPRPVEQPRRPPSPPPAAPPSLPKLLKPRGLLSKPPLQSDTRIQVSKIKEEIVEYVKEVPKLEKNHGHVPNFNIPAILALLPPEVEANLSWGLFKRAANSAEESKAEKKMIRKHNMFANSDETLDLENDSEVDFNLNQIAKKNWFPGLNGKPVTLENIVKALLYLYHTFERDFQDPLQMLVIPQIDCTLDENPEVRAQVCASLIGYGFYHLELIHALILRLNDKVDFVRNTAMKCLATYGINSKDSLRIAMIQLHMIIPKSNVGIRKSYLDTLLYQLQEKLEKMNIYDDRVQKWLERVDPKCQNRIERPFSSTQTLVFPMKKITRIKEKNKKINQYSCLFQKDSKLEPKRVVTLQMMRLEDARKDLILSKIEEQKHDDPHS